MNVLYATCFLDVSGVTKINRDILKGISREFTVHVCETESDERLADTWEAQFSREFGSPLKLWKIPAADRYAGFIEYLTIHQIDLVYITHSLWVYEHAARLKRDIPGIKLVDSLHVLEPYCFRGGYPDISANRFVHRYMDRSIVISDHLLSYIRSNYTVDQNKFVVIRNGIDTAVFRRNKAYEGVFRAEIGVPADVPLIGFIGRFAEQKRPLLFLEIAKGLQSRFENICFYMIGSGDLGETLRSAASMFGITEKVMFLKPRNDIEVVLNSTDLLIVTSSYEGAPLTILEALATGVPVVSSDVGAIREYIGRESLVPSDSNGDEINAFVEAAARQLASPQVPDFNTEEYSIAKLVTSYAQVFRDA